MGAAVMLVPSLRYLRATQPEAEIHVLTSSTCHPVWDALGLVDPANVHVVENRTPAGFLTALARQLLALRKLRFDLVIDYELFMRIAALASGCVHAAERAGFHRYDLEGLYRGDFYDHRVAYNQNQHIARNYLALTKSALLGSEDVPNFKGPIPIEEIAVPPTYPTASDAELAAIVPGWTPEKRMLVVCPDVGKHLAMRNYPRRSFARVLDIVEARLPDLAPVMVGTESDRDAAEAIRAAMRNPARVLDLCGGTTLQQLLQVISRADLVLTNDNGPAHFAALTGTPVVALFSTDSPFVYGPLGRAIVAYAFFHCSPCISAFNHKASRCTDNRCLQAITPERVVDLMEAALTPDARYRTINHQLPYLT